MVQGNEDDSGHRLLALGVAMGHVSKGDKDSRHGVVQGKEDDSGLR